MNVCCTTRELVDIKKQHDNNDSQKRNIRIPNTENAEVIPL